MQGSSLIHSVLLRLLVGKQAVKEKKKNRIKKNGEAWRISPRRGGRKVFREQHHTDRFTFRPCFFSFLRAFSPGFLREFSYMVCSNLISAAFPFSFPALSFFALTTREREEGGLYKPILYDTVSSARRHPLNRVSPSSIQDGERSPPCLLGSGALTGCLTDPHAHAPAAGQAGMKLE